MRYAPTVVGGLWLVLWPILGSTVERKLPDFSALVESNSPTVVNISTTQAVKRRSIPDGPPPGAPEGGPPDDFPFRYFDDEGAPDTGDSQSLGSGFVISADGYILTCAHVVENAKEIIVKLNDRREFVASVVGADQRSDVALLKIDATDLPKVMVGDPDKLKVGEWVLAIGSPFGFESSATSGIVSAKRRSLPKENYVPFIQTDVAINPGNSGGPLFNMRGEVVGINSQIYSRTGGFMGLSFAVPIDLAMQIAKQLRTSGHFRRGWAGITIQDVSRQLAESFHLKRPAGALVADILPGSPAARSELQVGDVVVEFEGRAIELSSDLPPLVGQTTPGSRARLTVMRHGQVQSVSLTIGELPEQSVDMPLPSVAPADSHDELGLSLADLTPEQRRRMGVNSGVLVNRVSVGPAYRAGLRKGDVVVQFDGRVVRSAADLNAQLARAPRDRALPLLVRRGASALFLALRIRD